jgi:UPF0755 protein
MKKSRPLKKFMVTLAILLIIVVVLAGIDFYQKVFIPYAGYRGDSVTVTISKGSSVSAIARLLYRDKIISNYYYFRVYYQLLFKNLSFKTGEYRFDRPMNMKAVIAKLHQGLVVLHKITFQEGLTVSEISQLVASHGALNISVGEFMRCARDPRLIASLDPQAPDLEGYLFPDTYMVRKETGAEEFVQMMVNRFKDTFTHTMRWRAHELNLSIRQVVTLASLIEKETSSREERFLISSVFHNRLRRKMGLDCDPTIIYALKRDHLYNGKLGWKELKYDSPYNTRLYRGLPPGPICSPGFDSLEAALYPENTRYLFFVAKNSTSHYFSETLAEHNRAVQKYIINR